MPSMKAIQVFGPRAVRLVEVDGRDEVVIEEPG